MKNGGRYIIGMLLLTGGLAAGCGAGTESMPDGYNFKPDAAEVFGEVHIPVWDLIGKSEPDNMADSSRIRVMLQYRQEQVQTVPAGKLYHISADTVGYYPYFYVSNVVFGVPLSEDKVLERTDTIRLTLMGNGETEIELAENNADFEYYFPPTGFDYSLEVRLKNVFKRGTREQMVIAGSVDGGNAQGIRRTLTGQKFDMDLSAGNYLVLETKISVPKGAVVDKPTEVFIVVRGLNIKLEKAVGYFSAPSFVLEDENLKMNLDILSDLVAGFDFSDPRYYIVVSNKGLGAPLAVNGLQLTAVNRNQTKSVTLETDQEIRFSANSENVLKADSFAFTPSNSNLLEFLKLPPNGNIKYSCTIQFNPEGKTENTVYADGMCRFDSYLEIPMVMKGSVLVYRDTLRGIAVTREDIAAGQLTVAVGTDIPFGIRLAEVSFYSSEGKLGDITVNEQLSDGKVVRADVGKELIGRLGGVEYMVAVLYVYPSQDILNIRQNAALKMNYSLLVETGK